MNPVCYCGIFPRQTRPRLYRENEPELIILYWNMARYLPKQKASIIIHSAGFTRSGRGSVRLERCVRVAEVPGSNPGAPTEVKQWVRMAVYAIRTHCS